MVKHYQQNFDGLVTIQNVKNPKYVVEGNILKVYPDTKLVGNIQVDVFQGIKNTETYKLKTAESGAIYRVELSFDRRYISFKLGCYCKTRNKQFVLLCRDQYFKHQSRSEC